MLAEWKTSSALRHSGGAVAKSPLAIAGLLIMVLLIIGNWLSPGFSAPEQIQRLLIVAALLGIVAAGQNMVILGGREGIDLSVGGTVSLSAIVAGNLMDGTNAGILPALFACALVGGVIGLLNGIGVNNPTHFTTCYDPRHARCFTGTAGRCPAGYPLRSCRTRIITLCRPAFFTRHSRALVVLGNHRSGDRFHASLDNIWTPHLRNWLQRTSRLYQWSSNQAYPNFHFCSVGYFCCACWSMPVGLCWLLIFQCW